MKALARIGLALLLISSLRAETLMNGALDQAALDYAARLRAANDQLARTRDEIAKEKAPLLASMRAAEDRIVAAQSEITRLETAQEQSAEIHRKLARDADALRKNENYLNTLAHDSLTAFGEGLLPGEQVFLSDQIQPLEARFGDPASLAGGKQVVQVADFILGQVRQELGGYLVPGQSLVEGDNRMVQGTFALAGPEAFFRSADGAAGTVRLREGTGHPVTFLLPDWKQSAAAELFQGQIGRASCRERVLMPV